MRRPRSARWAWMTPIGLLALAATASAQGVTGSTASRAFDPFANPNTNPWLSPMAAATQMQAEPMDRTTAGLYFLGASRYNRQQRMEQERLAASRERRPATSAAPTSLRRAYSSGTSGRFSGGGLQGYYGQRGSYFPR